MMFAPFCCQKLKWKFPLFLIQVSVEIELLRVFGYRASNKNVSCGGKETEATFRLFFNDKRWKSVTDSHINKTQPSARSACSVEIIFMWIFL